MCARVCDHVCVCVCVCVCVYTEEVGVLHGRGHTLLVVQLLVHCVEGGSKMRVKTKDTQKVIGKHAKSQHKVVRKQ
jgi:hypothetical protein